MLFPEAVTFSVCPGLMSLPQEDRKALGALVVLSPSLSFANSPRSLANNFRIDRKKGTIPITDSHVYGDEQKCKMKVTSFGSIVLST
jgi:hypothetical protein